MKVNAWFRGIFAIFCNKGHCVINNSKGIDQGREPGAHDNK